MGVFFHVQTSLHYHKNLRENMNLDYQHSTDTIFQKSDTINNTDRYIMLKILTMKILDRNTIIFTKTWTCNWFEGIRATGVSSCIKMNMASVHC